MKDKMITDEQLILELKENIDEFDDHQRHYIKSVIRFFNSKGYLTEQQREWLTAYYEMLQEESEEVA